MDALTLHRRPTGLAMMSSKTLSALSWLTAAVAALALGTMAYIPARQVAQDYRVNVARAQTVAVQHATSTAISANMPVKMTIVAAYPEPTMNVNAQGIPASEARPIQVEPIVAAEIPVTYAPITIIPPRATAVNVDGVVSALGVYRDMETPTPSATSTTAATDTPIPFPTHAEAATVADLPIVDIVPTETIQPTVTLEPSPERMPTPEPTETPRPTSVPEPTITPVPVVVVTDTPEPTIEPSATATSVLISPLATPTREATATP